jgi:polar amino acid transport system ATP-binding protein
MVFQEFNLWPDLTIEENIAGPLKWMHGSDPSKIRDRVVQCAKLVQIESILQKYPNEVSGGQKQRAAIARALAPRPEVLLFDEITSALDPDLAFEILQIIEALTKTGITMVVVTHHMNFARRVSHGIAFMAGRRLRPVQKPEDFFRSITPEIRDFLRHVQDL